MIVVLVASALRHRLIHPGISIHEGWGGTMLGSLSTLSCLLGPNDTVRLVGRVGAVDIAAYRFFIEQTYGRSAGCIGRINSSGLLSDTAGTNFHDATHPKTGPDVTRIAMRIRPLEYVDVSAALRDADAAILNPGDLEFFDADLIREIKIRHPNIYLHVDVHTAVWSAGDELLIRYTGWPGWHEELSWADSVQMNRIEATALLGGDVSDEQDMRTGLQELIAAGVRCAVITMGADGLVYQTAHDAEPEVLRAISVLGGQGDAAGAGDAFGAAFCLAMARGMPIREAIMRGTATASLCCSRKGYLASGEINALDVSRLLMKYELS